MKTNIHQYIEQKKSIQNNLLELINKEKNIEENYDCLINLFKDQNISESQQKLERIIYLTMKISNSHKRFSCFFNKIEKILLLIKNNIQQKFSNAEIFDLFKENKRILFFLFEEKFLIPDQSIVDAMFQKKYYYSYYPSYFLPEIKSFLSPEDSDSIIINSDKDFDKKRIIGENDEFISELIRNDMIDGFISYVNKTSMGLNALIEQSIFETNPFLLKKKEHSLIEYSAFFGSMQIFKYLHLNGAKLTPDLCLYSIHGYNPEMIHYLIDLKVFSTELLLNEGLKESIKCHHNEIANYIQSNFLNNCNNQTKINSFITSWSIKYSNYFFFPDDLNSEFVFYYLCEYNYFTAVKFLLQTSQIKINQKVIL